MRSDVDVAETLRVAVPDALDVHLQQILEPRPHDLQQSLPVPAINTNFVRNHEFAVARSQTTTIAVFVLK